MIYYRYRNITNTKIVRIVEDRFVDLYKNGKWMYLSTYEPKEIITSSFWREISYKEAFVECL